MVQRLLLGILLSVTLASERLNAQEDAELPFKLSHSTTFITDEVDEEGYPDYLSAINERYRDGLAKEDNAFVGMLPLLQSGFLTRTNRKNILDALGIEDELKSDTDFVPLEVHFQRQRVRLSERSLPVFDETLFETFPKRQDYSETAAWLEENEQALNMVPHALERKGFFCPITLERRPKPVLSFTNSECRRGFQQLEKALILRAAFALQEGDYELATNDLLAAHRLNHFLGKHPDFGIQLMSIVYERVVILGFYGLAQDPKCPPSLLKKVIKASEQTIVRLDIDLQINEYSRMAALDVAAKLGTRRMTFAEWSGSEPNPNSKFDPDALDWNVVMKRINIGFDTIMDCFEDDSAIAISESGREAESAIYAMDRQSNSLLESAFSAIGANKSSKIGKILFDATVPLFGVTTMFDSHAVIEQDLMRVALAIAISVRESGAPPEKLSDLSPKLLARVPTDSFTGEEFEYSVNGNRVRVTSAGSDGEFRYSARTRVYKQGRYELGFEIEFPQADEN